MLYSFKGLRPAPLPFRITLPSGFTRTDPATFTAEEILSAGYIGPFTEPTYDPNVQKLDWVNGDFVVSDLPPVPPTPDWNTFQTSLLTNPDIKTVLLEAFSIDPTAVLALPTALFTTSQGGNPSIFYSAWRSLRSSGLISSDLITSIGSLALNCHLPSDFIIEITRPFPSTLGQTWVDSEGRQWEVVRSRNSLGQFLPDNQETPMRESLVWELA